MTKKHNYPELKDLIMEQVFLCGFAGFDYFLNKKWINDILLWQLDSGCFSYDTFNCSSHMVGLGAANLALFGSDERLKKSFGTSLRVLSH
jgi:hypothetical protein